MDSSTAAVPGRREGEFGVVFALPVVCLQRGIYDAQFEDSWVISWVDGRRELYVVFCFDLLIHKSGKLICGMSVSFFIHPSLQSEWDSLQKMARAMGVELFELFADGADLHGKPFKLIVWNGWDRIVSFRPAP